jgi:hypothetical protein
MHRMCLNDKFVEFNTQLTLMMVVFIDHSFFTINLLKHATHNAI